MFAKNPYAVGSPVGDSSAFIGRADILREVMHVLRHPKDNAIVLYGQRRIGKTSVLQELEAQLPKEGAYHPVFFDLQDKAEWPLEQVLWKLARKISDTLMQAEPDLGKDPETTFHQVWLPKLLNNLSQNTSLVLLFDEFDVLADPNAKQAGVALFPYLREILTMNKDRLNVVFVLGRKVDDLTNIALHLFKEIPTQQVSLLSYKDTVELVRLSEANNSLHWAEDAIEKVWQLTGGHPYLTQHLCSRVWKRFYEDDPNELPTVTPKEVEDAIPDTLYASRNTLVWLWDGLPPAERIVASALAGAKTKIETEEQLENFLNDSGVRVMIRELKNAPHQLQAWDLIEIPKEDKGYRFRVELIRRWIAEYRSLNQVQDELDRIEPIADKQYQAGFDLYNNEQLERAASQLRQAVKTNPNHTKANQLLAKILLTQGDIKEACDILEKLHDYQPDAARARLIQALLLLAQQPDKDIAKKLFWFHKIFDNREEKQLRLYERVLTLDSDNPEAKSGKAEILQRRGNKAYKEDDLKGALDFYQVANLNNQLDDKIAKIQREIRQQEKIRHYNVPQSKKWQGISMKNLDMRKFLKIFVEIVGVILVLVGSYYLFGDRVPSEPMIILEVEKLETASDKPTYSLTAVVSDKPYLIETIRFYPHSDKPIKQATFKYDEYTPVDLIKSQSGALYYEISKTYLQKAVHEESNNAFSFEYSKKIEDFTFYFEFEGVENQQTEFRCKLFLAENETVPCNVRTKGYLSLFRGIPWWGIGSILGFMVFSLIEIYFAFTERKRRGVY
jgi:tetratricopeptide (TPR) repeat protein